MWQRLERIPGLQRKGPLSRYLDTYNLLAVGEYESRGGTSDFTRTEFELRISDLWLQTQLWHFAVPHAVMFRLLSKVMPSWIHFLVHWKSLTNVYFSYTNFLYSPFSKCFASRCYPWFIHQEVLQPLYLSLVVICGENPRRSGILLIPDRPRYRFCRLMKSRNRRYPDGVKWSGTNLENRDSFYFPDASQMSAMVDDRSRQMKTQIVTVGDVSDGFRSLPIS